MTSYSKSFLALIDSIFFIVFQQEEIVKAVDGLSYNQLVEKIITHKNSSDNDLINQSLVAQNFLEESASQLTYHGLCELVSTMKDNELAIFFRNNHFSTIYKHKDVSEKS